MKLCYIFDDFYRNLCFGVSKTHAKMHGRVLYTRKTFCFRRLSLFSGGCFLLGLVFVSHQVWGGVFQLFRLRGHLNHAFFIPEDRVEALISGEICLRD